MSDKKWAETAVSRELELIAKCAEENAHKPNSEWWKSVFRIASVLKGSGKSHIPPSRIRAALHRYTPAWVHFKPSRERGIDYLFGRAMNKASPRYRIDTPPICGAVKQSGGSTNSHRHAKRHSW